jgi:hypothetical protein
MGKASYLRTNTAIGVLCVLFQEVVQLTRWFEITSG